MPRESLLGSSRLQVSVAIPRMRVRISSLTFGRPLRGRDSPFFMDPNARIVWGPRFRSVGCMFSSERRVSGLLSTTGTKDKTAVMGILERGKKGRQSKVRTTVLPNRKKHAIQSEVRKHVEAGSALYTDALLSY